MKIRIDFTDAGIGDYINKLDGATMWHLLMRLAIDAVTDSEVEWKRLSKFVYNLELPLTTNDS